MLVNVLDLEATCWGEGEKPPQIKSEIIQIGISVYDTSTRTLTEPTSFTVLPTQVSELSDFCTELTGLTDEDVFGGGITFTEAAERMREEFSLHRRTLATWGMYDHRMLVEHIYAHRVGPIPRYITSRHLNLKSLGPLLGYRAGSLMDALAEHGLEFEGRWHDAGSDAYNTGRIFHRMMRDINLARSLRGFVEKEWVDKTKQ